jgi:hypothetical protein
MRYLKRGIRPYRSDVDNADGVVCTSTTQRGREHQHCTTQHDTRSHPNTDADGRRRSHNATDHGAQWQREQHTLAEHDTALIGTQQNIAHVQHVGTKPLHSPAHNGDVASRTRVDEWRRSPLSHTHTHNRAEAITSAAAMRGARTARRAVSAVEPPSSTSHCTTAMWPPRHAASMALAHPICFSQVR